MYKYLTESVSLIGSLCREIEYIRQRYKNVSISHSISKDKLLRERLLDEILNLKQRRMELIRPSNEQSKSFIDKQEIRVFRTINWLEKNWNNFEKNKISIDQISVACALEYTKFRFTDKWINNCKNLNSWLNEFNKNEFMKLTIPKDA